MSLPIDIASFVSASSAPTPAWLPIADTILKASLLLGAGAAASFLLRRASASARHFVWTVALISALAIPVLAIALPRWQVPVLVLASADAQTVAPVAAAAPPIHRNTATVASHDDGDAATRPSGPAAQAAVQQPASISITWQGALFTLWLAGVVVIVGRLLIGIAAVQWMSRRTERVTDAPWLPLARELAAELGISSRLVFLRSPRATMPMAWGVVRPAVLMPVDADEWPIERLRIVLLHELAHVKRRDCLTHMVAQLACAAHWFNPLAWMAARHARSERERACDDLVLSAGTRGSDYAEELLEMARVMRSGRFPVVLAGATLAMAHRSQLEGRLISILDPKVRRAGMTRLRTLAASTAVTFAVMPLAALQPWTYASPHVPEAAAAADAPGVASASDASAADGQEHQVVVKTKVEHDAKAIGEAVAQGVAGSVATSVSTSVTESVVRSSIDGTVDGVLASLGVTAHATPHPMPHPMPNPMPSAGDQSGSAQRADPKTIAALTAALKDTDKGVRETAMHALVQMRDPSIFDPLVQALHDESADVREQAAHGLGQLRDKRAVDPLTAALKDANASVRERVVFALGQLRDGRSVDALMAATKDESADVREQAAFALGQIRDARAVPALAAALKDANEDVREQAVFALGQLRDASSIDGLTVALKDAKPDVREQAAFALGQIRDKRAVDPLTAALKDTDADVREQAAFALGQIRDRAAVEPLLFALKDANEDVREQAAFALGQLRDPRAIDALTGALKDVSSSVRQQAAFALGQISR